MANGAMGTKFVGLKLPAGETLEVLQTVDQRGLLSRPHITNFALGPNPKPGRHTIFAEYNGSKAVLGTLEMGRCEQFTVDFPVDLKLSHSGKSDVFLSGFSTLTATEGSEDEDFDEEESEEDDIDAPQAVPLLMPSSKAKAKQRALIEDEADDDDDDDDDEDSDEDEEYSDDDQDDDDDDDDVDDDDEDIARLAGNPNIKSTLRLNPLNGKGPLDLDNDALEDDSNDDDEDDDDEDEEEEEYEEEDDEEDLEGDPLAGMPGMSDDDSDDESSEDEDAAAAAGDDLVQALQAAGAKRAAPKVTPQPAKKAKVTAAKANVVPASAPAAASSKTQPAAASASGQQGLTGPAAAQWLSALKQFLTQSGGQTDMSKLGGVKKPEGVAKGQKLKAFLLQNPKSFAIDGNNVTLKK